MSFSFADLIHSILPKNKPKTSQTNETVISCENSSVNINGKSYSGSSIVIKNGVVIIDDKVVENQTQTKINIVINGNCERVETIFGNVEVNGNCSEVTISQGDINVAGNCDNVSTEQGAISVKGDVGSANTSMGNIDIKGSCNKASTSMGDINHR